MLRPILVVLLTLVLALPGAPWHEDASARNPERQWVTYKVRPGDTLSRIARRHRVTIAQLRRLNRMGRSSRIMPGQRLRIRERQRATTRRGKTSTTSRRTRATRSRRSRRASARARGPWVTYRVKRGDYLWRIADRFDVTIDQIVRNNRLRRRRIFPNQVLRIKRRGSQLLRGGVTLPRRGPGYVAIRPANSWGTPGTVRLLQEVYAEFAALHPDSVPAVVADLSREGGGALRPHKSHQRGVDVDVSYYKVNNGRSRGLEVVDAESMDVAKTWDIIRIYLNTGHVQAIFMDWKLQGLLHKHLVALGYDEALRDRILQYPRERPERRGIIRHSPGHHHHLHIRFDCERADDPCARPRTAMVPDLARRGQPTLAAAAEPPPTPGPRTRRARARAQRAGGLVELAIHPLSPTPVPQPPPAVEPPPNTVEGWSESHLRGPPVQRISPAPLRHRRAEEAVRIPRFGATLN